MENTAIICETNPFHSGHGYLFDTVKAHFGGIVTAVMSGNFVQRGEPAVLDKYKRAAVLLEAGADLVVELPFPWCAAGGECFAAGGVAIAAAMGACRLAFGSETGETAMLEECASYLDSPSCRAEMLELEKAEPGIGAAVLYDRKTREAGFSLAPNDKLAVWYLRQMTAQNTGMEPFPVKRIPYSEKVVSATSLRCMLKERKDIRPFVPTYAAEIYEKASFTDTARFAELAWTYFRLFAPDYPQADGDQSGLYRHLVKTGEKTAGGSTFFAKAATKKYTDARIRRTALFAMTGTPEPHPDYLPVYSVLLAAGKAGREYLRERSRISDLPLLTKPADREKLGETARQQYTWLEKADRLYTVCMDPVAASDIFMRQKPVIVL